MSATLDHLLEPIDHWLNDPAIEDVLINGPDNIWTFSRGSYTRHDLHLDTTDIEDIAIVAAAQRRQDIHYGRPLLSTDLKGRGRLQAVVYPCVPEDKPCLTIRRGSSAWPTLQELGEQGLFSHAVGERRVRRDEELLHLYHEGRYEDFLSLAVRRRRTIIGIGETASGKTHLSKALINEIPREERLIVIEDAQELLELPHPNAVALYCKKDPAEGDISASQLVDSALRMRIGRLFVQEIRDGNTANAFLLAQQSGHTGSITTVHARHCRAVFDRLRVLISRTEEGRGIKPEDITEQLHELIDVVVHLSLNDGVRKVDEVWFKDAHLE